MYERVIDFESILRRKSLLLLGPRQTGKSTLLKSRFKDAYTIDLLRSSVFQELIKNPSAFSEIVDQQRSKHRLFIVDEIQKMPGLLDDVQYWIENDKSLRFLLTGSSARKLKRGAANWLAGRAARLYLHPITYIELGEHRAKEWVTCLTLGGLPSVLTSTAPHEDLKDYVGLYLREEIQAEGLTRSIENFSRFLDAAALCQCEQVNFTQIGSDAQVPSRTIIDYFSVLEDTLVGALLPAFTRTVKRKAMTTAKFYFFDVGVGNVLANRPNPKRGSSELGKAFEHYIFTQLRAYIDYCSRDSQLLYWRSTTKFEVDFVIPVGSSKVIAIEVKSNPNPTARDWKGITALSEEIKMERKIVVTLGSNRRRTPDGIELLPATEFLEDLWTGKIF